MCLQFICAYKQKLVDGYALKMSPKIKIIINNVFEKSMLYINFIRLTS